MFAFMSGTARGSGGLLQCNMSYMPTVCGVVKAALLRCSKLFVTHLTARGNSLNIRKITLIRHSFLQGVTQFGL